MHPRAATQAGADRQVGVARDQRCHQRSQCRQVGGQIDVHVHQHGGVGARPDPPQSAAAALFLQPHDPHVGQLRGQARGDLGGVVGAGVVGDRDPKPERHRVGEVGVQPVHRVGQRALLVVHRHDDVEHRCSDVEGGPRRVGPRPERRPFTTGLEISCCHDIHARWTGCAHRWLGLCAGCEICGGSQRPASARRWSQGSPLDRLGRR